MRNFILDIQGKVREWILILAVGRVIAGKVGKVSQGSFILDMIVEVHPDSCIIEIEMYMLRKIGNVCQERGCLRESRERQAKDSYDNYRCRDNTKNLSSDSYVNKNSNRRSRDASRRPPGHTSVMESGSIQPPRSTALCKAQKNGSKQDEYKTLILLTAVQCNHQL